MEMEDDWIGTGCFLCYGQCVNFGVEGKRDGDSMVLIRPCSRGLSEIMRRRRLRLNRPITPAGMGGESKCQENPSPARASL